MESVKGAAPVGEHLLGPAQDPLVIMDGKSLRHAHVELVSAVNG